MSLIKLLFYFLIIYLIYRFVKLLIFSSKAGRRRGYNDVYTKAKYRKKEGETTINQYPDEERKRSKGKTPDDDYIDYEEVE